LTPIRAQFKIQVILQISHQQQSQTIAEPERKRPVSASSVAEVHGGSASQLQAD